MVVTALTGNCNQCNHSILEKPRRAARHEVAIFKECKHQFHLRCLNAVFKESTDKINELTQGSCPVETCHSVVHFALKKGEGDSVHVHYNQSPEERRKEAMHIFGVGEEGTLVRVKSIPLELNERGRFNRVMRELERRHAELHQEEQEAIEAEEVPAGRIPEDRNPILREHAAGMRRVSATWLFNMTSVVIVATFAFHFFSTLPAIGVSITLFLIAQAGKNILENHLYGPRRINQAAPV